MSSENEEASSSLKKEILYPDLKLSKKNETAKFMDTYVEDMAKVVKAADFAARRHRFQKRKDVRQTPYVNHCIGNNIYIFLFLKFCVAGVAYILTNEAKVYDAATLAAAILHDTVEDTKTTLEEIETEFGSEVCDLVRECTDDKSLSKEKRKELQIVNASNHSHKVFNFF